MRGRAGTMLPRHRPCSRYRGLYAGNEYRSGQFCRSFAGITDHAGDRARQSGHVEKAVLIGTSTTVVGNPVIRDFLLRDTIEAAWKPAIAEKGKHFPQDLTRPAARNQPERRSMGDHRVGQ